MLVSVLASARNVFPERLSKASVIKRFRFLGVAATRGHRRHATICLDAPVSLPVGDVTSRIIWLHIELTRANGVEKLLSASF